MDRGKLRKALSSVSGAKRRRRTHAQSGTALVHAATCRTALLSTGGSSISATVAAYCVVFLCSRSSRVTWMWTKTPICCRRPFFENSFVTDESHSSRSSSGMPGAFVSSLLLATGHLRKHMRFSFLMSEETHSGRRNETIHSFILKVSLFAD